MSSLTEWTEEELESVGEADELELTTSGRAVTIWVVRAGDELYIRSYRGQNGRWFHRAQKTHRAHISAGGISRDVALVATDAANDAVDAAYQTKYGRYGGRYVDPMIASDARATTLKLVPAA